MDLKSGWLQIIEGSLEIDGKILTTSDGIELDKTVKIYPNETFAIKELGESAGMLYGKAIGNKAHIYGSHFERITFDQEISKILIKKKMNHNFN